MIVVFRGMSKTMSSQQFAAEKYKARKITFIIFYRFHTSPCFKFEFKTEINETQSPTRTSGSFSENDGPGTTNTYVLVHPCLLSVDE